MYSCGMERAFSGIIKNTISKIKEKVKLKFTQVLALVLEKSYEVGLEFYKDLFQNQKNKSYFEFKNKDKKFFDLRKFVHDKPKAHKVNIDHVNHDTFREKQFLAIEDHRY